jgi:hypothetical protein
MAPFDAIVETWGDDAQGKGRSFSKQIPQHHTLTLRPGDALFLPKMVWHRVTSTPDSLAISLGVYGTNLEALTQEHEGLRNAIKTGDRLDARVEVGSGTRAESGRSTHDKNHDFEDNSS